MKRLEHALEDCLERMASGEQWEECLRGYPQYANELRPLLLAAAKVEQAGEVHPSDEFRAHGRARLISHMLVHPHRQDAAAVYQTAFGKTSLARVRPNPIWKLTSSMATSVAVVVLALFVTGTAAAQSALPGHFLYDWKLTSETVWLAVSPDPVATDLALAERRAQEALAADGENREVALQGLDEILTRLINREDIDPSVKDRIQSALMDIYADLEELGISLPALNEYLSLPAPAPVPGILPDGLPVEELPGVLPGLNPTELPLEELPGIIPTLDPLGPLPTGIVPDELLQVPLVDDLSGISGVIPTAVPTAISTVVSPLVKAINGLLP